MGFSWCVKYLNVVHIDAKQNRIFKLLTPCYRINITMRKLGLQNLVIKFLIFHGRFDSTVIYDELDITEEKRSRAGPQRYTPRNDKKIIKGN